MGGNEMIDYEGAKTMSQISKTAKRSESLCGSIVYRNKLTHIVGEPGVGKTTFTYAFGLNVSNGLEFIGIKPSRLLKVLIVDFESGEEIVKDKYDDMNWEMPDTNLRVVLEQDLFLDSSGMMNKLRKVYESFPFDLMFIDNQGTAFPIRDENDNAEAVKHLTFVRKKIAVGFNCGVVIYHHPAKSNALDLRKGSGAFAWARYCDIAFNMIEVDKDEHIVQLLETKNRIRDNNKLIFFKKIGIGLFEECLPPSELEFRPNKAYAVNAVCKYFTENMKGLHQRKEFVREGIQLGHSEATVDNALKELVKLGMALQGGDVPYGFYNTL